ncbi:MAG TPA: response regulator [Phototrophicaceae bacterium]|jgi:CheY-like chemotaxis protein|nr:response regulator [Phototrophicaceae bacterium]
MKTIENQSHSGNRENKLEKKRICIVDDEPDIILLCKLVLEDAGFKVYTFTDSLQALSNFKPNFYDLVILDIKMPNMDGFELCKKINEIDNKTKVCFLTASEMYYETFRKRDHCKTDKNLFLRKPIENDELVKKINKIIET